MQEVLEQSEDPMAALLFSSLTDAMRQANWLALGFDEQGLTLKAAASGPGPNP